MASAAVPAWAQSRADSASRTAATVQRTQIAAQQNTTTKDTQAAMDIGDQEPVSVGAGGGLGFYAQGETALFYTSNPNLSKNPGQGDMYFAARASGGLRPHLVGGLYADAHVGEDVYEYANFTNLDFNRFSTGGGLDYVFEKLGNLTASVRYEYERYLNNRNFKEFYVNNAITTALYKEFLLNDINSIQLGWQGTWAFAVQPTVAQRQTNDFWIGWNWRIIEHLELQTFYTVSLYGYNHDGNRVDVTQNVGGSLTYRFTQWARITASANFGANNSTESYFDYTVVNLGGALGLDFRF